MLRLSPRVFTALGLRVSRASRLFTAPVHWWRGWLRPRTVRRPAARRLHLRQRRSVRPGLEPLESRELLNATPGVPDFAALRGDLTQLRNDANSSAVALVNAAQPSPTNTLTLASMQSQENQAWSVLTTDANNTWQAVMQVEYAALGAVQQTFDTLLNDLGLPLTGQSSSPLSSTSAPSNISHNLSLSLPGQSSFPSPPTPSIPGASPAVATATPNAAPMIVGSTADSGNSAHDPSQFFFDAGTYTWTAPAGVTSITVQAWGAGGGAGGGVIWPVFDFPSYNGGSGGGGGAFAEGTVAVTPGTTYYVVVGQGGAGSTNPNPAGKGGDSFFYTTSTEPAQGTTGLVSAQGGFGPTTPSNYPISGGQASASTGSITYSGGNGGGGYRIDTAGPTNGAGGGAGASPTGAGASGQNSSSSGPGAGGVGTGGGGSGGNGSSSAAGSNGSWPGGGGGGGGYDGTAGHSGGNGGNGEVIVSWVSNVLPVSGPVSSSCNCGCPNEPGSDIQTNTAAMGPMISTSSGDPVRYADGVVTIAQTDLHSDGAGFPWGQTRSWTNGSGYTTGSNNGNGWVDTYTPHLIEVNGSTNTLFVIANGTTAYYYDLINGVYQPRFDDPSHLSYNSSNDTYTLIDGQGDQIVFNGFGSSRPAAQRGELASYTDATGVTMAVTSYTSDGHIAEMQRSTTSGSDTITESWLYRYLPSTDSNAGLLSGVTLRTQVNGGAWTTVQQVQYTYYDGTQQYGGNPGDLMTATVTDGSGNVLDTNYYRYYTSVDLQNGQAGYYDGLKYAFNSASYERLTAALGTNLSSLTDAQVAPYADNYFQYDSQQRVTQETVQGGDAQSGGGLSTTTYSYTASSNAPGVNSWATKTVVGNPDGSSDTVYTDAEGLVMLSDHYDPISGQHTIAFHAYNDQGQLILDAAPSAVTGYDDSYADLLNNVNGTYQYLNNSSGLITRYDYYTTTTATETTAGGVAGYQEDVEIQQGQEGTLVPQETWQYYAHAANGQTIAPVASDTVYRNDDGTGAETTTYSYTWFANSAQMQSETVSAPVVSAAQNGPGTADVTTTFFDEQGNPVWVKDPDGYIQYYAYDPATGAQITHIVDVNTADTGEFTNLPTGWTTPAGGGLNLITTDQVDAQGRTVKETSPDGNITYYVYLDAQHEERIYQGWNSSTGTPTGPTEVILDDAADGYTETFTMTAVPNLNPDGTPNGTEAISGLQSLTRDYTNDAGQVIAEDSYFNLGGLAYTAGVMGTLNVNYYQTQYGYDNRGRLVRTQTANGTIYRTVYNSLSEAVSDWVGTNDTPTSGEWSPTNNDGTSNMVQVSSYQYDNGSVGDGNLTQETDYPGLGATPRVTDNYYDWRDREVATKSGVQASENDGVHRPIVVTTYDNLNEATETQQYDGDGVTPQIVNGVLQTLSSSLLRAQEIDSYDDQQRLYQTQAFDVNPNTGAVSSSALTTNYYYDHRGDQIAESDPGGLWTKSQFDGVGRDLMDSTTDGASGTTWADASSVANDTVLEQNQMVFDDDGNAIETIDSQRFDNATGTGPLGNPSSGIGARVYYAANYYDNADRLTSSVDVGTNGGTAWTRPSTPPASSATTLVTMYAYNAMGLVQDVTDPQGIVNRTLYDNLGRTIKTIQDYTGGTPGAENDVATEYGYDGDNNTLYVQADEPGGSYQKTAYVYGVTTASGSAVNSNDILSAVQHPDPTTGQPSSSQQESYLVNVLGQTVQYTDRNGNVHQYSYDVLGRLTSDAVTTLGAGVDGSVRRIDYGYDSQGNQATITSYDAVTGGNVVNQVKQSFNGLGQMTGEYQSHSGAVVPSTTPQVQYAYNEMANGANNSRLVSMTYPSGYVLNYNYNSGLDDTISRLSSLSDSTGVLEEYKYLGLGNVVERNRPQTNVKQTLIFQSGDALANSDGGDQYTGLDRFGRVIDQNWVNTTTGQATDRFQMGYNQDGDVLYRQNLVDAVMSELDQYDNLHQLINFQRGTLNSTHDGIVGTPSASQNWDPDALGNFNSVTTNGTTQTRTANQQNEITGISGAGTVTYDANGNLTADGNGNTYNYDAWNRLVAVNNNGTTVAAYGYDGLDHRITEIHGSTTTDLYLSSSGQVLEERVGGVVQARNVWGPSYVNELVLRDQSSQHNGVLDQRLYVQQDANWNVTALVDTSGNVVERYDYAPFGAQTVLNPDFSARTSGVYAVLYGFQGMRGDLSNTLLQAGKRVENVALMRWLQPDPTGLRPDDNSYRFVGNDPTNSTDPYGLESLNQRVKSLQEEGWTLDGKLPSVRKSIVAIGVVPGLFFIPKESFVQIDFSWEVLLEVQACPNTEKKISVKFEQKEAKESEFGIGADFKTPFTLTVSSKRSSESTAGYDIEETLAAGPKREAILLVVQTKVTVQEVTMPPRGAPIGTPVQRVKNSKKQFGYVAAYASVKLTKPV
jgi:RHS repeat-associated protein